MCKEYEIGQNLRFMEHTPIIHIICLCMHLLWAYSIQILVKENKWHVYFKFCLKWNTWEALLQKNLKCLPSFHLKWNTDCTSEASIVSSKAHHTHCPEDRFPPFHRHLWCTGLASLWGLMPEQRGRWRRPPAVYGRAVCAMSLRPHTEAPGPDAGPPRWVQLVPALPLALLCARTGPVTLWSPALPSAQGRLLFHHPSQFLDCLL